MKTRLILGAAALALAACGSSGGDKAGEGGNDSASVGAANQSAAAKAPSSAAPSGGNGGGGDFIQPGEWETKVESMEVDAPGMPQGVKDMMTDAMGSMKTTIRDCVTPEEAKRPNADMFAGKDKGNCTASDFSMSGGRMRGTISCPAGNGQPGSMTMVMDGQFSPQSYTVNQNMTTDAGGSKMTIKARVSGRRVGECTAATKAAG